MHWLILQSEKVHLGETVPIHITQKFIHGGVYYTTVRSEEAIYVLVWFGSEPISLI